MAFKTRDRSMPARTKFARDSLLEGGGFEPSVPGAKEPVSFAEGELRGIERGRPTKVVSLRGTDGSNPSPSSGESGTNGIPSMQVARSRRNKMLLPTSPRLCTLPVLDLAQ